MSKDYTQFDWAVDRSSVERWADEEDRMIAGIDRRLGKRTKRTKFNKKNHMNYV
jgi:hypothetical protein